MKKNIFFMVVAMLCLNYWVTAQAQNQTTTVAKQAATKPLSPGEGSGEATLKVGDKLPASFWEMEHEVYQNGKIFTQTLASCKGKLLILDFWASWCGSCINRFPKIENMQSEYVNKVKILLVNSRISRDGEQQIRSLFTGNTPPFKMFSLPTVYLDDYLTNLFPHRAVPYCVWIDQNGTVVAISNSVLLTSENVKLFLKN